MSSGLVGLHMEGARKGTCYDQEKLASSGKCSLLTISKATDVKSSEQKGLLNKLGTDIS